MIAMSEQIGMHHNLLRAAIGRNSQVVVDQRMIVHGFYSERKKTLLILRIINFVDLVVGGEYIKQGQGKRLTRYRRASRSRGS